MSWGTPSQLLTFTVPTNRSFKGLGNSVNCLSTDSHNSAEPAVGILRDQ